MSNVARHLNQYWWLYRIIWIIRKLVNWFMTSGSIHLWIFTKKLVLLSPVISWKKRKQEYDDIRNKDDKRELFTFSLNGIYNLFLITKINEILSFCINICYAFSVQFSFENLYHSTQTSTQSLLRLLPRVYKESYIEPYTESTQNRYIILCRICKEFYTESSQTYTQSLHRLQESTQTSTQSLQRILHRVYTEILCRICKAFYTDTTQTSTQSLHRLLHRVYTESTQTLHRVYTESVY